MRITWHDIGSLLLLVALLLLAFLVFSRVRRDYRQHSRLTRPVAILQTGTFFLYALASYAFLDSRFSHVDRAGWLFPIAIAFMVVGSLVVLFSMPFLGRRSFGRQVGSLWTGGLYRFSRNPQLVGGFFFIVGYAMLWPSWDGACWAGLWLLIARWMVRGEEEHLKNVFGEQYRGYCRRVPRYLGLPRK